MAQLVITRCELVPGTPPPPEIPEGVDAADLPMRTALNRKGEPVTFIDSYLTTTNYHPGVHYEVEATITQDDGSVIVFKDEFEGTYPVSEIPTAMAQKHLQTITGLSINTNG